MITIRVHQYTIEDISLCVFDKDGTLIDLYAYWSYIVRQRAKKICGFFHMPEKPHQEQLMYAMGVDRDRACLLPEGPVGRYPRIVVQGAAVDYLRQFHGDLQPESLNPLFDAVDKESWSIIPDLIKPLPGALDIIRCVKEKKGKIAVATSDRAERAQRIFHCMGIEHLIDCVVGSDTAIASKPDPAMLELITQRMQCSADHAVMIGDSDLDIRMGIRAHFKASIGVFSGSTTRETLEALTPYVVKQLGEIVIH